MLNIVFFLDLTIFYILNFYFILFITIIYLPGKVKGFCIIYEKRTVFKYLANYYFNINCFIFNFKTVAYLVNAIHS